MEYAVYYKGLKRASPEAYRHEINKCGWAYTCPWEFAVRHPLRQISLTVRCDDFTSTGRERDLKWLEKRFASKFEETTEHLGPGTGHPQQTIHASPARKALTPPIR